MKADLAGRAMHMLAKPKETSWFREDHWHAEMTRALRPHLALAAETTGPQAVKSYHFDTFDRNGEMLKRRQ